MFKFSLQCSGACHCCHYCFISALDINEDILAKTIIFFFFLAEVNEISVHTDALDVKEQKSLRTD